MPRLPRLLGLASVTLAAFVAACGPTAAPPLTDPDEIILKSVETLQNAKSVHFEVGLAGTFNADLFGTGTPTAFPLDSTKLAGDLDIANKNARITFDIPALLGLAGEVLVVGDTSYIKTSLTGPQYQKSTVDDATGGELPTDPAAALAELRKGLQETPGVDPVKGPDAPCGDKQCYTVDIALDPTALAGLGGTGALPTDLPADGAAKITLLVEKDTLRPASFVLAATAAAEGSVTVTITMSKWDEPVTISAPPADQVSEGDGLFGG